MFLNLKAEMARAGVTNAMLAEALNINKATVSEKLTKPARLKFAEAAKIKAAFFPELSIDYLFEFAEEKAAS